ncbi:MAG: PIN domain-containing protein [Ignavibacteriae bacterium]|nr:PIN domain-containing protein [Ignavibacteriota bacterium]
MYLLDSNVWLERLLNTERADEVRRFLNTIPSDSMFITDLSFHSIGIILDKLNKRDLLLKFVHDMFIYGAVNLVQIIPMNTNIIVNFIEQYKLDFDDAYQYAAAEKYNLEIVSFDTDFVPKGCLWQLNGTRKKNSRAGIKPIATLIERV